MNKAQEHTLHELSDVDWFSFGAEAGQTYKIETVPAVAETLDDFGFPLELVDTFLWLHDQNGLSALRSSDDNGTSKGSLIVWTAPEAGKYYLAVNSVSNLSGADANYQIRIHTTSVSYLPLVQYNQPVE